jgi:nonribosomal peptide synthetase protein VioF
MSAASVDLPLLPAQQPIIMGALLESGGQQTGLVQETDTYAEPLDETALRSALAAVIDRYGSLRTTFRQIAPGEFRQRMNSTAETPLTVHDLRNARDGGISEMARIKALRLDNGIALDRPPLLRCDALIHGPKKFTIVWTVHHAVSDGWSWDIVLRDFHFYYAAYRGDHEPQEHPAAPIDYDAFVKALAEQTRTTIPEPMQAGLAAAESIALPPRGMGMADVAAIRHIEWLVGPDEERTIRDAALSARVTVSTIYLQAFGWALARACRQRRVPIGVISSGRNVSIDGIDRVVACLARKVPIPVDATEPLSSAATLSALSDNLISLISSDDVDFATAVASIGAPLGVRSPDASFVFQNYGPRKPGRGLHDALVARIPSAMTWLETGASPLSLVIHRKGDGLVWLRLEYRPGRVNERFAETLAQQTRRGLTLLAERGGVRVRELPAETTFRPDYRTPRYTSAEPP